MGQPLSSLLPNSSYLHYYSSPPWKFMNKQFCRNNNIPTETISTHFVWGGIHLHSFKTNCAHKKGYQPTPKNIRLSPLKKENQKKSKILSHSTHVNYFVIKQKERKKLIIKQTKTYSASEFEHGTCVEKFLRVQAVILTFGNMHIRCCPVVEFQTCIMLP